ncbi:DNA polymerase III subunit alpha [Candidatus Gracilibacteria bacterium]|nr:DNA polymerase III subunit alpha [Candidatus Gracilibacteria bacterium]
MNFIYLQNHSYYSLLQGLPSPKKLASFAKEKGMKAIAMTDSGNLYGALEFYQACEKEGVKAILGCEMFIAPRSLHKKENRADGRPFNMLFLAENNEGYKNLTRLSTTSFLEGMYYKPRIDYEVIEKNKKGLIAIDSGRWTKLASLIIENGSEEEIESLIKKHLEIFGPENYFFGILDHKNTPVQLDLNEKLKEYGKKFGVKCVALQNSFYLNPEDAEVQDIVTCIATGRDLDDGRRDSMIDEDYSLKDPEDMIKSFEDFPEAIENTEKIADRCNVSFELYVYRIPDFYPPKDVQEKIGVKTPIEYFRHICIEGLKERYSEFVEHLQKISWKNLDESTIDNQKIDLTPKSKREDDIDNSKEKKLAEDSEKAGLRIAVRFEHEFKIIQKMGFESYFLMVSDYCKWARDNDIMVGPGRGSGAGSIIAYAMKITNIDPLRYGLLFERFLNPDRVSMPDFDIDFEDNKRDQVIAYVTKKYGADHVAQISTFGTMAARAAIKDVGRIYGIGFGEMNEFAKLIPEKPGTKLAEAWEEEALLREKVESEEKFKKVWDAARILEGNVRHISVHACAVVIADKPLENYTALQHPPKNDKIIISQFSAKPLETLGLLKMDFLGLKNLSILKNAIHVIKQVRNVEIDINNIPIADKKTLELFKKGETTGIFQFESGGMKKYLKELEPTRFEDLIAMNSLYRPGPMEYIPTFIKGKHFPSTVKYPHESLEEILKETYGIAVYQEQILQIAQIFAGYSLGQADLLRRAIGKKIAEEMVKQRGIFIQKAVEIGRDEKLAEHIFDDIIVPFAGYGFNKSHAAAYSMVAYQTAYLKAHYPTEFMAALLMSDRSNADRVAVEIQECNQMGIDVLPPDVNESFENFTVVGEGKIRFGLSAIKNLGDNGIEAIISERKANGKFKNITDFISRLDYTHLNKKNFEALIFSGATDCLGERNALADSLLEMIEFSKAKGHEKDSGQMDLFGMMSVGGENVSEFKLKDVKPADIETRLDWEREFLGLFVSQHPLAGLENYILARTFDLEKLDEKSLKSDKLKTFAGLITGLRIIRTKKGEDFSVFNFETPQGNFEAVFFPKSHAKIKNRIAEGKSFLIKGKIKIRNGGIQIVGEELIKLKIEELRGHAKEQNVLGENKHFHQKEVKIPVLHDEFKKEWVIKVPYSTTEKHMAKLKEMLLKNTKEEGGHSVRVILPGGKEVDWPKMVDANGKLRSDVLEMFKTGSGDLEKFE